MGFGDYFSINIFFIIFRETLECVIIVSVLLAFLEQNAELVTGGTPNNNDDDDQIDNYIIDPNNKNLLRKLRFQVWSGALCGIVMCLLIGGLFILTFYLIEVDLWAKSEHYWEGVFSIVASIIISIMAFGMLQLNKLEKKWHAKLGSIIGSVSKTDEQFEEMLYSNYNNDTMFGKIKITFHRIKHWFEKVTSKHVLFILPFVTTLRECLESIVFIGGIGLTEESRKYLISIILGIIVGSSIGLFVYKSGTSSVSAQKFMIYSTSLLYILSAGLLSKGVWQFELQKFIDKCGGLDVSEVGSGPGSYDVDNSIWHVDCCNGEADGPWMIFTAIFGWTNSATRGSVSSYVLYWMIIIIAFKIVSFQNRNGYLPIIPYRWQLKKIKKNYQLLINLKKDTSQDFSSPNLDFNDDNETLDSNSLLLPHQ